MYFDAFSGKVYDPKGLIVTQCEPKKTTENVLIQKYVLHLHS